MHSKLKQLSGGFIAILLSACAATPISPVETSSVPPVESSSETSASELTSEKSEAVVVSDADTCGASALKVLVGKSTAAVQMPADKNIRIIGVNTPITKDLRPERMNIHIDEIANITDVTCG